MKIILALLCFTFLVSEIVAGPPNAEPQLRRSELPLYPPVARQARIAGTVKLSFVINTDGSVRKVQALSGHPMLKASAVANVKSWRFRPGDGTGKPEATEFVFHLSGQDVASNPKLTVSVESFRHIEITTDVLLIPDSPVVRNPD